ncbi:MAG: hypothetical protein PHW47_13260 [Lachnospira sp.]|nr:hypothetical protein [Lachnospira sp.]
MSPINPMKLMQIKSAWEKFTNNHPKFPMFMRAVSSKEVVKPDSIIEINVTTPEGKTFSTNIKVKADDMELLDTFAGLS